MQCKAFQRSIGLLLMNLIIVILLIPCVW